MYKSYKFIWTGAELPAGHLPYSRFNATMHVGSIVGIQSYAHWCLCTACELNVQEMPGTDRLVRTSTYDASLKPVAIGHWGLSGPFELGKPA